MSRFFTLFVSLSGAMVGVGMVLGDWFPGYWIAAVSLPLLALGIFDLLQTRHPL